MARDRIDSGSEQDAATAQKIPGTFIGPGGGTRTRNIPGTLTRARSRLRHARRIANT